MFIQRMLDYSNDFYFLKPSAEITEQEVLHLFPDN